MNFKIEQDAAGEVKVTNLTTGSSEIVRLNVVLNGPLVAAIREEAPSRKWNRL